jgi:putative flavoprotein involved in K+ transport
MEAGDMKTLEKEAVLAGGPLVESGEAFRRLGDLTAFARPERFDVIVIGGGQAGLSVGYHLRKRGLRFLILDANQRIGDAWRKRWDTLRLFTPAKLDGLDGMRFPAPGNSFPTKDQMADYLEAYAERFALPVRPRTRVERLYRRDNAFVVQTNGGDLVADQVVVAMSNYQQRKVPAFATELRPDIVQLHSGDYRNPDQLAAGAVLIAGAGNSGAEIARELAGQRPVFLAGADPGEAPIRMDSLAARLLTARLLMRVLFHRVLTIDTPMGRKARPKIMSRGTPLIRVKRKDLAQAGVKRLPRLVGVRDGRPLLADGSVLDVANVIWCTGFHCGFSWLDLPVLDQQGEPLHTAGVAEGVPGLFFVGLHFLYAMSSSMVHGVGRDAQRIAGLVANESRRTARGGNPKDAVQPL